ncbi:MAG: hypothetical protein MHM6MM_007098, partial [Cercozoa sp. M6MM]
MDEEYDVIIMGTGLKECILSGLLCVAGKKVLQVDRNDYYGSESASLDLEKLFAQHSDEKPDFEVLGRNKDYNVDLTPKFLMACGDLIKVLLHTKVTHYLQFKSVAGSFVYKDGRVHKVPATPSEALNSKLMGIFQKRRFKNFLQFAEKVDKNDRNTWAGHDLTQVTMRQLFAHYKCDDNTVAFTGHAIALHLDDSYLDDPAQTLPTIAALQMYAYSVARYGKSPYIYPVWGLAMLPESFSRLAAIHGGTFMLRTPVDEVLYENGKAVGIKSEGKTARATQVLGDPTYFKGTDKIKASGQVARWLFLLDRPIEGTDGVDSCQVIIPARQTGRNSDIYVSVVSGSHEVCPRGRFLAMISAKVETANPKQELSVAARLLPPAIKDFFWVCEQLEPTNVDVEDNVFITKSYDASSHFQSATEEVCPSLSAFAY